MNEQLETALANLINKSVAGINSTKDFLSAEIPDVVQQLLMWHGIYSFILFLFSILYFSLTCVAVVTIYKKNKDEISRFDGDEIFFVYMLSLGVFFGINIPVLFTMNFQWLKIWITPKVWLIEYAANLVTGP